MHCHEDTQPRGWFLAAMGEGGGSEPRGRGTALDNWFSCFLLKNLINIWRFRGFGVTLHLKS